MAALAVLVLAVSLVVLRGSLRIRTAVPVVAFLQAALHLGFELASAPGVVGSAAGAHASHAASSAAGPHPGLPMLVAHLATTVLTALVLVLQDRAVVFVRQWLATPSPTPPVVTPKTAATTVDRRPLTRWVFLRQTPRRGPPMAAAAAP